MHSQDLRLMMIVVHYLLEMYCHCKIHKDKMTSFVNKYSVPYFSILNFLLDSNMSLNVSYNMYT